MSECPGEEANRWVGFRDYLKAADQAFRAGHMEQAERLLDLAYMMADDTARGLRSIRGPGQDRLRSSQA